MRVRNVASCSFSVRSAACFRCNRTNVNTARAIRRQMPRPDANDSGRQREKRGIKPVTRTKKHVLGGSSLSALAAVTVSRAIALLVLGDVYAVLSVYLCWAVFCCSITRKSCLVIRLLSIRPPTLGSLKPPPPATAAVYLLFPCLLVCMCVCRDNSPS